MQKHTAQIWRAVVRYVTLTLAACLIVVLYRIFVSVNQTTIALSFLVLIVITASRWRLAYSVYLSILCTLFYNFFFLPPVGRLTIADPENWITLAAFLCTSVLVSHLAEKERSQAETSETRRQEMELLYHFSQQLMLQEDFRSLARSAPSIVASVFGFRAVALYVRNDDAVYYSDPQNELLPKIDLKLLANSEDKGISRPDGFRLIHLVLGIRHPLGMLAVDERDFSPGMYEAIGSMISIALERALALERNSRLEASRESERLRGTLLDSVTHDLRTPLTSIRAAATTLMSQPDLTEKSRTELITVVEEESARLDRLIGQAIEMAQLDADTLQVHTQLEDISEVIELSMEEMQPLLREHKIILDTPDNLPRVPMDRRLVHRVLRHLLENAVKYSPAGRPITIQAAMGNHRLLISVTDDGPGIESEDRPFIFEKFFRGRQQQSQVTGTGMGLAIVRAILAAHGGGIDVASAPQGGARFTFWLPLARAAELG